MIKHLTPRSQEEIKKITKEYIQKLNKVVKKLKRNKISCTAGIFESGIIIADISYETYDKLSNPKIYRKWNDVCFVINTKYNFINSLKVIECR